MEGLIFGILRYYGLQLFKCLKVSATEPFKFRHATLLSPKTAV